MIIFFRICIKSYILNSEKVLIIKCPKCDAALIENDIKIVLDNELFIKYQQKQQATLFIENKQNCYSLDCNGYILIDSVDSLLKCNVCQMINCLKCKSIHFNFLLDCGNKLERKDSIEVSLNHY